MRKWFNPPLFDFSEIDKAIEEISDIEEPEEYPCTICDFIAKSENGLGSHMRAHERRGETVTHANAEEYAKATKEPEKPVTTFGLHCTECNMPLIQVDLDNGKCPRCGNPLIREEPKEVEG